MNPYDNDWELLEGGDFADLEERVAELDEDQQQEFIEEFSKTWMARLQSGELLIGDNLSADLRKLIEEILEKMEPTDNWSHGLNLV